MREELRERVNGKKMLILGVGNRLRGDDGVGSVLVGRLQGRVYVPLIDTGDVPENYLGPIEAARADLVLVIDAADLGASPGEIALVKLDQLREAGVSTHITNLSLLFKVIPRETRPDTLLLAIQPESTEFGRGLSQAVQATLENLVGLFVELFGE